MCVLSSSYLGGPAALTAVWMLTLHTLLLLGRLLIWNNTASDVVKSKERAHTYTHILEHRPSKAMGGNKESRRTFDYQMKRETGRYRLNKGPSKGIKSRW